MPSMPSPPSAVAEKPIILGRRDSTIIQSMSVDDSNTSRTVMDPHYPPEPQSQSQSQSPNSVGSGWFETRQALQKEMSGEKDSRNRSLGGFSIRGGLVVYLVITLGVLTYESVYIILYFAGVIPDILMEAASDPDISPEERAFLIDLEAKQHPWLWAQIVWYSFGILFCFYGFVVLYLKRLDLFKIFQVWLMGHILAYFVAAVIFEQFSPVAINAPGYVILTMFIALLNVYAGYISVQYKKQLVAMTANDKFYGSRPAINDIESPL